MNLVFYKLSGEIRTFTLIQFLGAIIGSISALYFYAQAKSVSAEYELAAQGVSALTLLMIGLCDFFIHRNAGYLKYRSFTHSMEDRSFVEQYENAKEMHLTTKFVVPLSMLIFGLTLFGVFCSFPLSTDSLPKIMITIFFIAAALIFILGAYLGRVGWKEKEKK